MDGESWLPHLHGDFVWWCVALRSGPSISSESLEAEKFQPMSVAVATEQFGWTFSDSLRSITACI